MEFSGPTIYSLIVGTYIVMGGLASAAINEAFQGILIIVFSILLIPGGLAAIGGWEALSEKVPQERFLLLSKGGIGFWELGGIFLISIVQIHGIIGNMGVAGSATNEFSARFGAVSGTFAKRIMIVLWAFAGLKQASTASVKLIDAELMRAHSIESFDTGVIRAESSSEVQFWFGASHACGVQIDPILQIEGTRGRAIWYYEDHCEIIQGDSIVEEWSVPTAAEARWEMIKTVVNKLSDRAEPVSTAIVAREHTSLIEAAHKSTTIKTVNPALIDRVQPDNGNEGDFIPSIRGLPESLQQAFEEGSTLTDTEFNIDSAN